MNQKKCKTEKPWTTWLTATDEPVVLRALRHLRDDLHAKKTDTEELVLNTLIGELNIIDRKTEYVALTHHDAIITKGVQ